MLNKLILKNISYKYPNKKDYLFQNINLTISQGDFMSLVGNSGSGKSTLAKILGGYIKPDKGLAYINVESHIISQPKCSITTVFQDYKFAVFPWLNVKKNIELALYKNPNNSSIDFTELINILFADYESGNPKDILTKYPNQLSGGQIQRIQIARAIYSNSQFIIFDEADSSLDIKNKERIKNILFKLKKIFPFGLLIITHDIEYAIDISSSISVLNRGLLTTYKIPRDSDGNLIEDCNTTIKDSIINSLSLNSLND